MNCFSERDNCLKCLALGCFWAILGDGTPWCVKDPSLLSDMESTLIPPGNWRLCPSIGSTTLPPPTLSSSDSSSGPDFNSYGKLHENRRMK